MTFGRNHGRAASELILQGAEPHREGEGPTVKDTTASSWAVRGGSQPISHEDSPGGGRPGLSRRTSIWLVSAVTAPRLPRLPLIPA